MPTERPLTAGEKTLLKGYTRKTLYWHIVRATLFGWFVFSLLTFALLFTLWKWIGPHVGFESAPEHRLEVFVLSVTLVGAYLGRSFWQITMSHRDQEKNQTSKDILRAAEDDLKGGVARIETFHVTEVIEITEVEDEGAGFLLSLEDGRVLCVIGQDLYEYAHDAEEEEGERSPVHDFPSTLISYAFAPSSGIRLDLKGMGSPLKTAGRVEVGASAYRKDKRSVRYYTGPEDGAFYDGPMQNVLNKFSLTLVDK